tara:strand:- start:22 stop:222 length:201 start_codon:yes stop_codon:yes gene_type:complete
MEWAAGLGGWRIFLFGITHYSCLRGGLRLEKFADRLVDSRDGEFFHAAMMIEGAALSIARTAIKML